MSSRPGRPPFGYMLIDLPADHEIDQYLSTECQVVHSILTNRKLESRIKWKRISSVERFEKKSSWREYKNLKFVHIGGHADRDGISLLGGSVSWEEVAQKLCIVAPKLEKNERRILCLSCCYSENALDELRNQIDGHFTGCYYFLRKKVKFADAITVWSMFYLKKNLENPKKKIAKDINCYFDKELIGYKNI